MFKLSKKAADDFGNIYEYTFLNFGEEQADLYTNEMDSCLINLSKAPMMECDCSQLSPGIRRQDFLKHAIFYRVREDDIFIIRILHQQMNAMLHL